MGSKNADKVVLRGQGHEIPDAANGDVLVILRVAKHDVFERIGADLAMNYEISLKEALCGYDVKIQHFGKKVLHLKSRKGEIVQPGQLKKIVSQGMVINIIYDLMCVKIQVDTPAINPSKVLVVSKPCYQKNVQGYDLERCVNKNLGKHKTTINSNKH